ncbi:hypothetical protein APHAL10511_006980 [Amanita phalloides]|nr:hypothetical protein APHAL10511_006980 [Amanita phalloides]
MNLPKFLLRRAPRAAAQPSEQLADPHDAGRSESPFSFVSRPSSSHSTQDLSPTSEHPSDEGDRAFNEAIVLLSRYRDAFHDIAQFQQLEDRLSKLSSLPPNPPPGKLIKGARKLQINELARTNSERYRAEATSLLRDVQATIGNLNATSSSASAAHGLIPSAVRSSTTPLSSGKTEFPLQQNGMEHHNSIRRYKSSDAQGRSGTSAPIVESSIPRPLPVVHEETSEGMSRDRHHDLSRSKYYEDRKYRKERDRAKDKERRKGPLKIPKRAGDAPIATHIGTGIMTITITSTGASRQKERERDKDRERRRDRGEERHQERERIRVQAMDNAINEEPEDHRESEDLVGVQEEERRLEDGEPDMQTPTEQSEQIEYIDPPNEDDGNVKETEVETPDPGNKGHPEQPLALQYHRQDVKEREKARERRRERTKERDDLDGHRGHHDQHYYDDKYGWTSKGLPYDYHYTDKYQAHKRSHSHTGYPYGYYDRRRYEDYGIHAIRGQRSDDDRHRDRDRDRDRDKERYDRHHYRDKRDYEQERDRNGHDRREQQVFPQGNHESSHVRNRGSDEEPILMIPPPGWRAQQRQNQDHHRDGKERRPSPIKATQTQHTTTPISSPAPPTLLDYPTSVRSASMAVIVPTAAPAGRTAAGNPKPGGTSAGTHWNPEALRNREQAAQAQKLSNNEPQITEPPVVWNQASLVATAREQQKKQRFRRIPWFPTPAGSRLLEMFSPQVAKGRKQPLPPVGMKFDSHLD